jgi:iron complex outermembrane receptor protein
MKHKTKPKTVLRFKRWTHKKYSIFNSIGKALSIGTLATMMLSNGSNQAFGQVETNPLFLTDSINKMAEIEIEASKSALMLPLIDAITVFSAQEIQRAGVQNLQDLLQFVSGLDLKTRGNEGVQADLSYRGSTFDQIAILINGINFTDPQTGHHNLNIPIIFSEIDRIEILKGPGAWSAGNIAFAGAINIIYKEKKNNRKTQCKLTFGDYNYLNGEISTNLSWNKFHILSGINRSQSSGYINNTDFKNSNYYTLAGYKDPKWGDFTVQFGFNAKDFGANSFYTIKYKDQYEETRSSIASLTHEKNGKRWRSVASVYFRQHRDMFQLFRYSAPSWYTGNNYHLTNTLGANYQISKRSQWGITTISLDFRNEQILSSNLGKSLEKPVYDPFYNDTVFKKGKVRTHFSGALTHKYFFRGNTFTFGVMESGNNDYGFNTYGGFNFENRSWINNGIFNFFINNSYRLPTFTDLYYSSPSQTGNPDLKPEQSLNSEISYRHLYRAFLFQAALFYKYGFQMIDWVKLPTEEKWHSENLQNVSTYGSEIQISYRPKKGFINRISLNYTYLDMQQKSSDYLSMYVTDYLKHQVNLIIDHDIYKGFSANWMFSFNDRNGNYIDKITLEEIPYPTFFVGNLKLNYERKNYQLFLEISNIFNQEYFDYPHIMAPGRWIKCGIHLKL